MLSKIFSLVFVIVFSMMIVIDIQERDTIFIVIDSILLLLNALVVLSKK